MQSLFILCDRGIAEQLSLHINLGLIRAVYIRPGFVRRDNLCRVCSYSAIVEYQLNAEYDGNKSISVKYSAIEE